MRPAFLLSLLVLLPSTLSACGSHADAPRATALATTAAQSQTPLVGTTWLLEAYGDAKNPTPILEKTEVTAIFGQTPGRVTGSAGCNGYGADYMTKGERIEVGPVIATKKFCSEPPGIMEQELQFATLLRAAAQYRIIDGKLEIVTGEGKLLRFKAKV